MAPSRQASIHHLRNRHGSESIPVGDLGRKSIADRHKPFDHDVDRDEAEPQYSTGTNTSPPPSPGLLEKQLHDLPSTGPALALDHPATRIVEPPKPTWLNLPNKSQLSILALSRFVDFFQMAALQTYMVHQLKSFDPELPDQVIAHQSGVLQGAFTAAQIVTSILWGRAADQPQIGRKTVLNIGLVGTGIGCIGVGFSKTYGQAVFWRFVSGAINGTVGSARTMVAEITPKPWHARAFLLLPAAFNFANMLGPMLSGALVDPTVNLAHYFGPGGTFGGSTGVAWMEKYPYAAANLISTVLLFSEALLVTFFLEETLKGKEPFRWETLNPIRLAQGAYEHAIRARNRGYQLVHETQRQGLLSGQERSSVEMDRLATSGEKAGESRAVQRLPFRRIWTSNVLWTLLSIAIFDFHMGAFNNLWILFLATPREFIAGVSDAAGQSVSQAAAAPKDEQLAIRDLEGLVPRGVFKFAQGLAFPPPTIGFAMAIIGFVGIALQFLLYPSANARWGQMRCFRASLFLFPAAYYLAPFIALLPSATSPPDPASGLYVWSGIGFVVLLQVAARTFALPASIMLLNNSSPHPSVLGTIHGVGNACSATFRTLGPILSGYWFGLWTERGIIGMAWWIVASVAALGCVASFWVRNGTGHEIFLPGEEQEEKEAQTAGGSGNGR
ncbi:MFS general substrate transporter [Teratosphaeria destructans]|uniref:MFS general substrate transporter n=1 Tax=Teratosphaeria destructans TaxID=418781 RepID=A0A9W7SP57_9PEZI|nr:MFS general substrate transporter [Teratosphaeria destructans]